MAKLYLANCTKQPHDFLYRVPGEDIGTLRRIQSQRIEPGTQQVIHGEAPMPVLEAIVEQHRAYGLVRAEEIVRTKEFIGLCYSFDKPVDLERLNYAVDHNQGVLFDRGLQQRAAGAIAADRQLEDQMAESQRLSPELRIPPLRGVEVELLEDGDAPKLGEGLRVVRDDDALAREGGKRAGRGR